MNILHNLTRKQILIYSIAASVIVATLAVVIFSVNFHHTYPKELVAIDSLCVSVCCSENFQPMNIVASRTGCIMTC